MEPPTTDAPSEQLSSLASDQEKCGESSGYSKANTPGMWTEGQKRELYQREVENHNCIIEQGQASEGPPSEEVFLDTFGSDGGWYQAIAAYLNSGAIDQSEYSELLLNCPPPLMFNTIPGF